MCFTFDTSVEAVWLGKGKGKGGGGGGLKLDEDICFTQRTPDAVKDKIFSVIGFEQMLWSEHAAILANDPTSMADKYTDNHYALPVPQAGLTALSSHFNLNPA